MRRLKDFGRSGGGNDIHDSIGYNFKFTELQACLGIEQMNKLQWRIKRKKEIYSLYKQKLADIDEVKFFNQDLVYTTPWFIDTLVDDRENLIQYLKEKQIGSRVMYPPISRQVAYNTEGDYPVSFLVGKKGLWLPSASQLSNEEVEYICSSIKSFYK